jgi:PAS domain S-box-containing protein
MSRTNTDTPAVPVSSAQRSLRVLYVTAGRGADDAVVSHLEGVHGMIVDVVSSVRTATDRLERDPRAVDCLVIDTGVESVERSRLERVRERHDSHPLIVYADTEGGTARCREYLHAGVSDVVPKSPDSGVLLARRIEHCVALERERTNCDRLRMALDRMDHGVVFTDSDGRIEYVNRAFESLGYERDELGGRRLDELRSAEHDETPEEFWETVTSGSSGHGELTVRGDEGDPITLAATPIRDDDGDGEVCRVVAVGSTADRELADARKKYRALIDAAPDAVFVADVETGEIVEANEAATDLLGRSRDDIIGMHQADLHPDDRQDRYRDLFERYRRTGGTVIDQLDTGEPIHVVTADGDRIPVEITATTVEVAGRTLAQGHVRDITERKRRERTLRSFREAVEQAGHVIMITDTDGTIEYVNPAFEVTTGYSEAEALGQRPSLLKSGEHDEEFYADLWQTISSGEVWQGEIVNERKDGERYCIEQTIAPITDEEGTIERFIAVNRDITERKRYEDRIERERDRLEEFAGTVAHDLRNPLTIALGHVELARRNGADTDRLETAMTALERMETIIDEVLTLSEQGETIAEPEPVRLDHVAEKAWDLTATSAASLSLADDLVGSSVHADESRLCELLENLFRNAIEHAGPDVTVTVGTLPDGDGFFVEDTGPGIRAKDRNRIFESGYTTSADGTGFGLAIVKQIVEAHGWEITAMDATGDAGGARFEIVT